MRRRRLLWSLVLAVPVLVCVGCGSDDATRWEPHVVPSATSKEEPKSDRKPEPELKLKREPGTRI